MLSSYLYSSASFTIPQGIPEGKVLAFPIVTHTAVSLTIEVQNLAVYYGLNIVCLFGFMCKQVGRWRVLERYWLMGDF